MVSSHKSKLFSLKRFFKIQNLCSYILLLKCPFLKWCSQKASFIWIRMSLRFSLFFPLMFPFAQSAVVYWDSNCRQGKYNDLWMWEPLVFSVSFYKILYFWLTGRKYKILEHNIIRDNFLKNIIWFP